MMLETGGSPHIAHCGHCWGITLMVPPRGQRRGVVDSATMASVKRTCYPQGGVEPQTTWSPALKRVALRPTQKKTLPIGVSITMAMGNHGDRQGHPWLTMAIAMIKHGENTDNNLEDPPTQYQ